MPTSNGEIDGAIFRCVREQLKIDKKGPYNGLKKLSDYQYAPGDFDRFLTDIVGLLEPVYVFTPWNDSAKYFGLVLGGLVMEIVKQTRKAPIS